MNSIKFLAFLVVAAFLTSCGGGAKQEEAADTAEEQPVEVKVVGKEISYATDSTSMNGYLAYDENSTEKKPGVIVVHEWWGHNDYSRDRANLLAEMGYVAFALDMYGDGQQAEHPEAAMGFVQEVFSNLDEAQARFDKAVETLKAQPGVDPDKISAIGYCFGGSVVLSMANAGYDLDAVAAFHAGVQLPIQPDSGNVKAKILICNGADDGFIQPEHIEAYKAAMDAAGADYNYISYPGAVHGFTSKYADDMGAKFNLPLAYNAEADEQSWAELTKLLEEVNAE